MTNVLLVLLMIEVGGFGVVGIKKLNWIKLTFVPWFVSISNAVNPERK